MATEQEVQRATGNVRSGNGSAKDYERTQAQAKVAGSAGSAAREALKQAGKDKSKSWGNW